MLFKMKRGTKVGWLLVAVAILLSLWVIVSQSVFADPQLEEFVLSEDGTQIISYNGSGGDITIPEGVVEIAPRFFSGNSSITTAVLPSSLRSLGNEAFKNCTGLSGVVILGNIREIPSACFEGCTSLSSVTLPSSVATIGSRAFANCVSLKSAGIMDSVSTIMPDAFEGCYSIETYEVGSGNTEYITINDCLYDVSMTKLLQVPPSITSIKFADTCTTIGSTAFNNNTAISSLVLPSSITTIEAGAFSGSGIVDVTIPASVKQIGSQSGWSPLTIYGYSNTAAEEFAVNNRILFVVLGDSAPVDVPISDYELTPAPGDLTDPNEAAAVVPQEQTQQPAQEAAVEVQQQAQPQVQQQSHSSAPAGQTNTQAAASTNGKDATPKTADGDIDPRWFLIVGVLLAGLAVIVYARARKMEYVVKKKDSDLDS